MGLSSDGSGWKKSGSGRAGLRKTASGRRAFGLGPDPNPSLGLSRSLEKGKMKQHQFASELASLLIWPHFDLQGQCNISWFLEIEFAATGGVHAIVMLNETLQFRA